MSNGAFPFRAAKPKGAKDPPKMSFELPASPPPAEQPPAPEVQFDEQTQQSAEDNQAVEEDMAKKRKRGPGRPRNPTPTPHKAREPKIARFTFAEVLSVIGESEPVLKVVAKITPVIEILKPEDRKRVVDILERLYG